MKPEPPMPVAKNFESRVQDLIYNVDVGLGSYFMKAGLYVTMVLAIMSLYWISEFWGLKDADAMDQAQIARQLMEGNGFTTKYIRPAAVWMLEEHGVDPSTVMLEQPDLVHPPVYPWILARVFSLIGDVSPATTQVRVFLPEQWAIVPLGNLCTLLTGLVIFLLARRFFEPRIAVLSTTLFFVSEVVWANSISGLGISMAGLFAILSVYGSLVTAEKVSAKVPRREWMAPLILTGICITLAFLTRYAAGWILVTATISLGFLIPKRGWKCAARLAGVVLLLSSPWFIRNAVVSGSPFGFTPYLALNSGNETITHSFERQVVPSTEGWNQKLKLKWYTNFARFYETALPSSGNGILAALFVSTFFFRFSRSQVHILRFGLLAAMIGLLLVAPLFGEASLRAFVIFWPLIILYGVSFFYILLDRLQFERPFMRNALIAVLIALTSLPLVLKLLPPRAGYPYPPYYPSYITLITPMLTDDELLCTDMPWATAWYGRRSSVLLPTTIEEFYRINDIQKRISGIYFTTLTRDLPYTRSLVTGPFSGWYQIFREMIPLGFPLTEAFFISNRDQLFLTDRPRWPQR